MSITPCIAWVKKGVAKECPEKVEVSPDELKRLIKENQIDIEEHDRIIDDEVSSTDDSDNDDDPTPGKKRKKEKLLKKSSASKKAGKKAAEVESDPEEEIEDAGAVGGVDSDDEIMKAYGFGDYDDEKDNEEAMLDLRNLTYYASNTDDPYITVKEDLSDDEDYAIKATDNLLLVPRVKKDHCVLEVFVYNEDDGSLYVHHDMLLSSFPLSCEWLNFDPGDSSPGNCVAISTMEPVIDIWDVDLVNAIEPICTLGTKPSSKKKKKKMSVGGHTDSVLDLCWNKHTRNILASASADKTVCLWDLVTGNTVKTIKEHADKVQTINFHPSEASTLISGGFDQCVKMFDTRSQEDVHKSWKVDGEIERVVWNPTETNYFLASTEKGLVYMYDRRTDKSVFTLSAHSGEATTGLCFSSQIPGLLMTTSTDCTVKIWDLKDNKPSLIHEKDIKQGELLCGACCPDAPFVFAVGGSKDITVWDIREVNSVKKHFEGRSPRAVPEKESASASDAFASLSISKDESDKQAKKKKKKKKKKPAAS